MNCGEIIDWNIFQVYFTERQSFQWPLKTRGLGEGRKFGSCKEGKIVFLKIKEKEHRYR